MVNNNHHRAFLVKEMQMQADQSNRIEKQIVKVLKDNYMTSLSLDIHNKEYRFCVSNETKVISAVEIHKVNDVDTLHLCIDNKIIIAEDYDCDCYIDWVELMYRVLECIEPNIMD